MVTVLHSFLEEPGMGEGNDRHTGLFTIISAGEGKRVSVVDSVYLKNWDKSLD